ESTPKIILEGHQTNVNVIRFHPERDWLLSGDESGSIKLWDLSSRRVIDDIAVPEYGPVTALSWVRLPLKDKNETRSIAFVAGFGLGILALYTSEASPGKFECIKTADAHAASITDLSFDPIHFRLASAGAGHPQVWNLGMFRAASVEKWFTVHVASGSLLERLSPEPKAVNPYICSSVNFLDGGSTLLVTYLETHSILKYSVVPWKLETSNMALTRIGSAIVDGDSLFVGNLKSGVDHYSLRNKMQRIRHYQYVPVINVPFQIALARQGLDRVVIGGDDGWIRLFNRDTGEQLFYLVHPFHGRVQVVDAISSAEKDLVGAAVSQSNVKADIVVWNLKQPQSSKESVELKSDLREWMMTAAKISLISTFVMIFVFVLLCLGYYFVYLPLLLPAIHLHTPVDDGAPTRLFTPVAQTSDTAAYVNTFLTFPPIMTKLPEQKLPKQKLPKQKLPKQPLHKPLCRRKLTEALHILDDINQTLTAPTRTIHPQTRSVPGSVDNNMKSISARERQASIPVTNGSRLITASFELLPNETKTEVARHLKPTDLVSLSLTSRIFCEIAVPVLHEVCGLVSSHGWLELNSDSKTPSLLSFKAFRSFYRYIPPSKKRLRITFGPNHQHPGDVEEAANDVCFGLSMLPPKALDMAFFTFFTPSLTNSIVIPTLLSGAGHQRSNFVGLFCPYAIPQTSFPSTFILPERLSLSGDISQLLGIVSAAADSIKHLKLSHFEKSDLHLDDAGPSFVDYDRFVNRSMSKLEKLSIPADIPIHQLAEFIHRNRNTLQEVDISPCDYSPSQLTVATPSRKYPHLKLKELTGPLDYIAKLFQMTAVSVGTLKFSPPSMPPDSVCLTSYFEDIGACLSREGTNIRALDIVFPQYSRAKWEVEALVRNDDDDDVDQHSTSHEGPLSGSIQTLRLSLHHSSSPNKVIKSAVEYWAQRLPKLNDVQFEEYPCNSDDDRRRLLGILNDTTSSSPRKISVKSGSTLVTNNCPIKAYNWIWS
ncbi:hypothetical protein H0H93_012525, partial [Arthromyces matolae]